MTRAFEEIVGLMPPPEGVAPVDWAEAEGRLGTRLPGDYKAFADRYGTGAIAGEVEVFVPGHPDPDYDLLAAGPRRLEELRSLLGGREAARWAQPLGEGGLLAWGSEMGGTTFYWRTAGPPDDWPVVLDLGGHLEHSTTALTATELLLAVLRDDPAYDFVIDSDPPYAWEPWPAAEPTAGSERYCLTCQPRPDFTTSPCSARSGITRYR